MLQDATFDQIKAAYLASVTTKSLTDLQVLAADTIRVQHGA